MAPEQMKQAQTRPSLPTSSAAKNPASESASAELPTAGAWVRSLLASGFVPVKVEVIRTQKA